MNIDEHFRKHLLGTFESLNSVAAAHAFPPPSTLSQTLEKLIPTAPATTKNIDAKAASIFSTAAVDIWLRGVHSFLVSASLTDASPIWASVSGYYSSHYSIRGFAHLLGYFKLFKRGYIVELKLDKTSYKCDFRSPKRQDAEHKYYWHVVKQSAAFLADDLFTENNSEVDESDVRHRNHANYSDHLSLYPIFRPLDEASVTQRIEYISKMVFDVPPLPRFSKFPDLEFVQVIAYHRLVKFRKLLDEVLGGKNRFWNVHRNPPFAAGVIDFQLAEGRGSGQPNQ